MAFTVGNVKVNALSGVHQTIVASNTITATTTSTGTIPGIDAFSVVDLHLNVTAASGTTPTMNVYIQKLCPDGLTWDDLISFTQATAAADYLATAVVGNSGVHTIATRSLAAGTVRTTTLGGIWRVDVVIGGSTPSFTWALFGDFYA